MHTIESPIGPITCMVIPSTPPNVVVLLPIVHVRSLEEEMALRDFIRARGPLDLSAAVENRAECTDDELIRLVVKMQEAQPS